MPEKENEKDSSPNGYELLLKRLEETQKRFDDIEKKLKDTMELNNALLCRNEPAGVQQDKGARKKELEEKLMKGIK